MRKIIFSTILSFTFFNSAYAKDASMEKWAQDLEEYSQQIQDYSTERLMLNAFGYSTMMAGTCAASSMIVAATAVTDTFPVTNVISEGLANLSAAEYQTLDAEAFLSLQTLANTGRGTLGGAGVATIESFEFIFLWLSGRESEGFQATQKVYESTYQAFESLFSQQGKCFQSFAKLYLTLDELNSEQRKDKNDPRLYFSEDWVMP
ncbi:MAG: hypothetical protein KDD58_09925 [Bdellovibrionales bacterium]|nr:hypothetical protein [Bdellovibrionales bacterium]